MAQDKTDKTDKTPLRQAKPMIDRESRINVERRAIYKAYMAVNPQTGRTYADPIQASILSHLVKKWQETHTNSYMDDAISYCEAMDLPILNQLRKHLATVADIRRGKKLSKAQREGIKNEAFRMICNLIVYADATLSEAAGKAAAYVSSNMGYKLKASSLEKEYPTIWRTGKPSAEDLMRSHKDECPDQSVIDGWVENRRCLPEPSFEVRGNRRN